MNGVVEEEVVKFDLMLQKRITDVGITINKYFLLIQPAIVQQKSDRMMRDIEKTMGKPTF